MRQLIRQIQRKIKKIKSQKDLVELQSLLIQSDLDQKAINEINDKAKEFLAQKKEKNKPKKTEYKPQAPISNNKRILEQFGKLTDSDFFKDAIVVPRPVNKNCLEEIIKGGEEVKRYKLRSKGMVAALISLLDLCNNGVVQASQKEISENVGHQSARAINWGLNRLEGESIIEIDRTTYPFTYRVLNYNFKGGFFIIPKRAMVQNLKELNLKHLRAILYSFSRNYHSPLNKRKLWPKFSTIKERINAASYVEVERLFSDMKHRFFSSIEIIEKGKRADGKIKSIFDDGKLGIIDVMQEATKILDKPHFISLKQAFKSLKIDVNFRNCKRGVEIIESTGEAYLHSILELLPKIPRSKYNSVSWFKFLMDAAKEKRLDAIVLS